jgi:hypothetical protein
MMTPAAAIHSAPGTTRKRTNPRSDGVGTSLGNDRAARMKPQRRTHEIAASRCQTNAALMLVQRRPPPRPITLSAIHSSNATRKRPSTGSARTNAAGPPRVARVHQQAIAATVLRWRREFHLHHATTTASTDAETTQGPATVELTSPASAANAPSHRKPSISQTITTPIALVRSRR